MSCRLDLVATRTGSRGFSLVELLVVMAVLGVLAAMLLPLAEISKRREQERELKMALREIRGAIDAYHRAVLMGAVGTTPGTSGYPPTLSVLATGIPDLRNAGSTLYFLRRVPRDPFADPALPAESTWASRSYQSPPDRPAPGADVYDVASRSPGAGLNGVPLAQW